MVTPKVLVCPICGKRTYVRIENGAYLKQYPIRVYCMNCMTLMKGTFVTASNELQMYNANIEECDVNTEKLLVRNANYVIGISGELPCRQVRKFDGQLISDTPYLDASAQVDVCERITRLREFTKSMNEWKSWKSVSFQLLEDGSIKYISTALHNKMGTYSYQCDSYIKSLHCLQEVVHEETKNLFFTPSQDECIITLLSQLSKLDKEKTHILAERAGGIQVIIAAYRKMLECISSFVEIYSYVLPAETVTRYRSRSSHDMCIATCAFDDIKTYYQDTYEALLSLIFIPVCLDNVYVRGDYQSFNFTFNDIFNRKRYSDYKDDYAKYTALDNGMKLQKIQSSEPLQDILNIQANKDLRNGIGHNNIEYNGVSQIVTVYDQKNPEQVKLKKPLIDVAIDCIGLAKSSVLMSEILLFILRQELRPNGLRSIIHPRFYKYAEPNGKCPCGSGIKYKKCCRSDIEKISLISN